MLVRLVESFEKEDIEDKKVSQFEEQYVWLLLVSFIAFALEWIV